jgi:hypothetical protein
MRHRSVRGSVSPARSKAAKPTRSCASANAETAIYVACWWAPHTLSYLRTLWARKSALRDYGLRLAQDGPQGQEAGPGRCGPEALHAAIDSLEIPATLRTPFPQWPEPTSDGAVRPQTPAPLAATAIREELLRQAWKRTRFGTIAKKSRGFSLDTRHPDSNIPPFAGKFTDQNMDQHTWTPNGSTIPQPQIKKDRRR